GKEVWELSRGKGFNPVSGAAGRGFWARGSGFAPGNSDWGRGGRPAGALLSAPGSTGRPLSDEPDGAVEGAGKAGSPESGAAGAGAAPLLSPGSAGRPISDGAGAAIPEGAGMGGAAVLSVEIGGRLEPAP